MSKPPLLNTRLTSEEQKVLGEKSRKNPAPAFVYRLPDERVLEIEGFQVKYTPPPLPVEAITKSILLIFADCVERAHSKTTFHNFFKFSLERIAGKYGLCGKVEYPVDRGDYRIGRVDVVWVDEYDLPVVAIEIDNSNNKTAISKLQNIQANLKIWVYYGEPDKIRPPKIDDILVISARSKGDGS